MQRKFIMLLHQIYLLLATKIFPLFLSILGFGVLIVVHEFGHFLFCKLFGIYTPTFSIGFGKAIIERKIGTTNFRIAQIPLGGYVEIAGLQEMGQGDQSHATATDESSFSAKPYWQKFLVLMGGIIFNLIFAYLSFCTLFLIGTSTHKNSGIVISYVVENSAAYKAGLLAGDLIVGVENKDFSHQGYSDASLAQQVLLEEIRNNPNRTIALSIDRNDSISQKHILLDTKQEGDKTVGSLGSHLSIPMKRLPFFQAIKTGIKTTNTWICNFAYSFKTLFQQKNLKDAGGPVMILAMGFKTAQDGLLPFLFFFALMSINLALFNLLPLGITDGGQLVFATIESIIRRPLPDSFRIAVNVVSWLLFIVLALYLTYKDIYQLFGKTIGHVWQKIALFFCK